MTVNSFSKPLPLDPDIPQDALDRFDCDVPVLNQWLRTRSVHNEKYGSSRTYVAFDEGGSIAGYFCISNAVLDHDRLSAGFRRNKPNPLPCCLLGRLAVDKRYQGQGLGGALLVEALKITLKSSKAPTNYFTPNILRKSWSRLVVSVVHLDALAFPVAAT